jgi:hypothetical protein
MIKLAPPEDFNTKEKDSHLIRNQSSSAGSGGNLSFSQNPSLQRSDSKLSKQEEKSLMEVQKKWREGLEDSGYIMSGEQKASALRRCGTSTVLVCLQAQVSIP